MKGEPPEGRDAGRQVTSDVMAMTTSCRRQGGSGRYGTDPTQRGREAADGTSPVEPAACRSGGGLLGRWAGGCGGSPQIRLRCAPERDEGAPDRLTGGGCGGCGSPTKTRKHATGRRPLGCSIRRERVGAAGGSGSRSGGLRLGLGPATRFCSGSSP